MKIGNVEIGIQHPPFIIAEVSGNHDQSIEKAIAIIHAAKKAGASAVKFQTYTADTMTLNSSHDDFFINNETSLWKGSFLYELYERAHTPWEWHEALFDEARKLELIAFSSAFDESSIDFLENLNVPAYKIASFENAHLPLIAKAARTGKPLIISTGMATLQEIDEAVLCARKNDCKELILLKCTSSYPAQHSDLNLLTMLEMQERFDCLVGYSDHTQGTVAAVAAVALGATVIEKHIKELDDDSSVDSEFSLSGESFQELVVNCNNSWLARGSSKFGPTENELSSLKFRRSIYSTTQIKVGEVLSEKNIRIIRPGYGLHPRHFETLLGKVSKVDWPAFTALDASFLLD
jgi:pseudaminic acid synthase